MKRNKNCEPTVEVLIEKKLHPTGKFRYTHRSESGGRIREVNETDAYGQAGSTIKVFRFAKLAKMERVRRLVEEASQHGQSMIAVVSPAVFNQPEFRSILKRSHVEVLVEEPDQFEVEQLVPWIGKLMEEVAREQTVQVQESERLDPLEISVRLRDPETGRLDAREVAKLLGISISNLATKVCGVSKQALSQRPTSTGIQEKLQPLEEIAKLLIWCGGDQAKLRAWLESSNRDFPEVDGVAPSPMSLILQGHAGIVAAKVHHLLTGHPA